MNPNRDRRDVVVVGGRVAGSATAMLLALSAPLQLGTALAIAAGVTAGLTAEVRR